MINGRGSVYNLSHVPAAFETVNDYVIEAAVFKALAARVGNSFDGQRGGADILNVVKIQELRDAWRERYEALTLPDEVMQDVRASDDPSAAYAAALGEHGAYTDADLVAIMRDNENLLIDARTSINGKGVDDPAMRESILRRLDDIGIHAVDRTRAKAAIDGSESLRGLVDQMASMHGLNAFAGSDMVRAAVALESVARDFGLDSVIDMDAAGNRFSVPAFGDFGQACVVLRDEASGLFDTTVSTQDANTGENRVTHRISYMIPIAPTLPGANTYEAMQRAGGAQVIYAAWDPDGRQGGPEGETDDQRHVRLANQMTTGDDALCRRRLDLRLDPLGMARYTEVAARAIGDDDALAARGLRLANQDMGLDDGHPAYVGAGHTVEGERAFRERLGRAEDALGLSAIKAVVGDDGTYDAAVKSAVEGLRMIGDENSPERARFLAIQRGRVKARTVPLARHIMDQGCYLSFKADRERGQVSLINEARDYQIRATEAIDARDDALFRYVGKQSVGKLGYCEFDLRDAATGKSPFHGYGDDSRAIGFRDIYSAGLYDEHATEALADFLLGINAREHAEALGNDLFYPAAGVKGAHRPKVSFSSDNYDHTYLETPITGEVSSPLIAGAPRYALLAKVMSGGRSDPLFGVPTSTGRRQPVAGSGVTPLDAGYGSIPLEARGAVRVEYDLDTYSVYVRDEEGYLDGRAAIKALKENAHALDTYEARHVDGMRAPEGDRSSALINASEHDYLEMTVRSARENLASQVDVEHVIELARNYRNEFYQGRSLFDLKHEHVFDADFARDGSPIDNERVLTARENLWRFLTSDLTGGELSENGIDIAWPVTAEERAAGEGEPFGQDTWRENAFVATVDGEGRVLTAESEASVFARKAELARAYVEEMQDRVIGRYENAAEDGPTFNPATVLTYAPNFMGGGSQAEDSFVRLCRNLNVSTKRMRGDGEHGGDRQAQLLRARMTPFDEDSSMTLKQAKELNETQGPTPLRNSLIQSMEMVQSAARLLAIRPVADEDVEIDATGLVRYHVTVASGAQHANAAEMEAIRDGREAPRVARTVTGEIGRFAHTPEQPYADELIVSQPYTPEKVVTKLTQGYILAADGEGTERADRMRGVSFDERLAQRVTQQVIFDILAVERDDKPTEIGRADSLRRAYGAEETSQQIGKNEYDALVSQHREFGSIADDSLSDETRERIATKFRNEGVYNEVFAEGNADLMAGGHGVKPDKDYEVVQAVLATYGNTYLLPDRYLDSNVRMAARPIPGIANATSNAFRSVYVDSDGSSLSVYTERERERFDPHQVPNNQDQCRKRTLNENAEATTDRPIHAADPEREIAESAPIGMLPAFERSRDEAWNRLMMGKNSMAHCVKEGRARTVSMTMGGFTQDDGAVLFSSYARATAFNAPSGVRRIEVGDKVSDVHGNKGVVTCIVDLDQSREEVIERCGKAGENSVYYKLWELGRANGHWETETLPVHPEDFIYPPERWDELGIETYTSTHFVCDIDVVMSPVSSASRQNSGSLLDRFGGGQVPEGVAADALDINDPRTGETVKGAIAYTEILVHNKFADELKLDSSSRAGWQFAGALADDCPHLLSEIYGDSLSLATLREELNIACGGDIDPNGRFSRTLVTSGESARNVVPLTLVEMAGAETSIVNTQAEPNRDGRARGLMLGGKMRVRESVDATMSAIGASGGLLHVPFELTWPVHEVQVSSLSEAEIGRYGLNGTEDVISIGGQSLPATDASDGHGHPYFAMPIPSSTLRAGEFERGETARIDHGHDYKNIVNAAVRYEELVRQRDVCESALAEMLEAMRADDGYALEQATHYFMGLDDGQGGVTKAAHNKALRQMNRGDIAAMMAIKLEGTPRAAFERLVADGGLSSEEAADHIRAVEPFEVTERDRRVIPFSELLDRQRDRAQMSFDRIADDMWSRAFTGGNNHMKQRMMRATIKDSQYSIWSSNPDLDVDTIRVSHEIWNKISRNGALDASIDENGQQWCLLWRAPVLRKCNVRAFKVEIADDIRGVQVNPAVTTLIGGDFDGDRISTWIPHYEEALKEAVTNLSVERALIDDHLQPDGMWEIDEARARELCKAAGIEWQPNVPRYELGINVGEDAKAGLAHDPEARRAIEEAHYVACCAWKAYEDTEDAILRDGDPESSESRERIAQALEKRDAACRIALNGTGEREDPAIVGLNAGLKQAMRSSVGRGALCSSSLQEFVDSLIKATIYPNPNDPEAGSVKGKPKQIANVLHRMQLVPWSEADRITVKNICATGTDEERIANLREFFLDTSRFGLDGDEVRSTGALSPDAYATLDEVRVYMEAITPGAGELIDEAWRQNRVADEQNVSLAMNAKTTITAVVGVQPQAGHRAGISHDLVCDITEPVYQLSLDFKLDGEDALRKIPWIDTWKATVSTGQLFAIDSANGKRLGIRTDGSCRIADLVNDDGTWNDACSWLPTVTADDGTERRMGAEELIRQLDPTTLLRLRMADTGSCPKVDDVYDRTRVDLSRARDDRDDRDVLPYPNDVKRQLSALFNVFEQNVSQRKLGQFVDAMTIEADDEAHKGQKVCLGLDGCKARGGDVTLSCAFDSSRDGRETIFAVGCERSLIEGDDVLFCDGRTRQRAGVPCVNEAQRRTYEGTQAHDRSLNRRARAREDGLSYSHTTLEDTLASGEPIDVVVFGGDDFEDKLQEVDAKLGLNTTDDQRKAASTIARDAIELAMRAAVANSTGRTLGEVQVKSGRRNPLATPTVVGAEGRSAAESIISDADLVVVLGTGAGSDASFTIERYDEGSSDGLSTETVDYLDVAALSSHLGRATCEMNISSTLEGALKAAQAGWTRDIADNEVKKLANAMSGRMRRYDAGDKLEDHVATSERNPVIAHNDRDLVDALAAGELTVAVRGWQPETGALDWRDASEMDEREAGRWERDRERPYDDSADARRYDRARREIYIDLDGLYEDAELDRMTVVVGAERGHDYAAFLAASDLRRDLGSEHVSIVVCPPVENERDLWCRKGGDSLDDYNGRRRAPYFSAAAFDEMMRSADVVVEPERDAVTHTRPRYQGDASMAPARAARDARMVDMADVVLEVRGPVDVTSEVEQSKAMRRCAEEQGKPYVTATVRDRGLSGAVGEDERFDLYMAVAKARDEVASRPRVTGAFGYVESAITREGRETATSRVERNRAEAAERHEERVRTAEARDEAAPATVASDKVPHEVPDDDIRKPDDDPIEY